MIKRLIIMLVLVVLVLGGVGAFKIYGAKMMHEGIKASFSAPPVVSSAKAEMLDWQPKMQAVATLRAVNGADLSSELAGIVESIHFQSGDDVKAGDVLVQLRAEDDIAKLRTLQAQANLAQITYDRDVKQLAAQAVAQATVDSDKANLDAAKAQVAEQQAVVAKKTIRAPFSGHIGVRQVDIGQYLNPGTAIVTLQQLDPIYADFTVPEQALPKLSIGLPVRLTIEGDDKSVTGKITAINSKVDPATRNVQIRATFANPGHALVPGMFGNIEVDTGKAEKRLTLPQTAIVFNPYGNIVYLVQTKAGDDGKEQKAVQQTIVITGETRGDQIAINSGISEGDEVVTSGQVKLRNGSPVVINNDHVPSDDANPTPHEE